MLVVLPANQSTDLKQLAEQVGDKKLSFVNAETLKEKLGVEPGAVSPFGILNNVSGDVELWFSQEVLKADVLHFHPNRNTASLELSGQLFQEFLQTLGTRYRLL